MSELIVSRRFLAGTDGVSFVSVSGIGSPSVPVSTSSLPSRPASSELYSCSRPATPLWLLSPDGDCLVKPTTSEARSPFGYSVV